MEPDEGVVEEETIMLTRRVRRQQRADVVGESAAETHVSPTDAFGVSLSDQFDGAIAVSPTDELDESTRHIDERTVVVDRRWGGDAAAEGVPTDASGGSDLDVLDERTVVGDRLRRGTDAANSAATAGVPGSADVDAFDERTIVADRRRRSDPAGVPGLDHEGLYNTVHRPPAVEVEKTPAIYRPRAAPRTPHRPPALSGDAEPTRVIDPGVMSVTKDGRRRGLYAVIAVAGACVVSVVGLVLLGLFLIV
ncbi:MAG: hypothetical protein QM630_09185 [Microbacterium sp.]